MTSFYPLDLIRSNMQAIDEFKGKSALEVTKILMERDGLMALYKGLGPLLLALAASNFTYFYVNNLLKVFVKMKQNRSVTIWENILLNFIAGCVNVLVTNPLWVVATRLKLQQKKARQQQTTTTILSGDQAEKLTHETRYKGIASAFQKIIKNEGVPALWNGTVASLMLVLNPTIQFVTYDKLKAVWLSKQKSPSAMQAFLLAALAKLIASCLTYPIQTVQAKIRNDKKGEFKNTWECFMHVIQRDGVQGLYKGLDVNVVQKVSMAAFHFALYERILQGLLRLMRV